MKLDLRLKKIMINKASIKTGKLYKLPESHHIKVERMNQKRR
jgi:hypothetical protein